jgi:PAS domain S-box-containing protein
MVESVVQSHAEIVVGSDEKKLIRVLHVDDELGLLKVAKQCLELQGPFHVDTANSVEEALAELEKERYDAVVSDYQMPGKDGLAFLKELRAAGNSIPFIIFTGKGREEVAVKAWNLGADHYVNKSGDPETVYCELAHCLQSSVGKHVAEARTKETIWKLQTIYQNAVEGISHVDTEENIVYANKAFADIVGYEQDQLAGMNLHKIVDDENWAKIRSETEQRSQGKASRYEAVFRRSDGAVRNVLISGAPLLDRDGQFAGTVGIVLDITEQKRKEQELIENHRMLENILAVSADAIIVTDLSGTLLECNQAALDLFGFSSREEVIGRKTLDFVVKNDRQKAVEDMKNSLQKGFVRNALYTLRTKDNREFPAEISVSVVRDKAGSPLGLVTIPRDITDRIQWEDALRDAHEKWASLIENTDDIVMIVDGDGAIQFINRTIPPYTPEETIGKAVYEYVPKEQHDVMKKSLAVVFKTGKPCSYEVSSNIPKIGTIWFRTKIVPVRRDGKVSGAILISANITERRNAEETARESEEKWRSLFEMAPDGMATTDMKGVITSVNSAFLRLTGYKREDIVGKRFTKLQTIKPKDIPKYLKLMISALRGKLPEPFEYSYVRKDGTIGWGEAHVGSLKKNSKTIGYQMIFREITERKKAEEVLQKSEETFKTLMEEAPIGICNTDLKGKITYVNRRFEEATGYSREEIVGKNGFKFGIMSNETSKLLAERVKERLMGKPRRILEGQFKRKDGEWIWAEVEGRLIKKFGVPVGFQLTTRDITERKRAEKERKRYEERLSALHIHSRKLNTTGSMEEIYNLTLEAMEKTLGLDTAFFMVVDKDMLCLVDHRGYPEDFSIKLPLNGTKRGISVKVAKTGRSINIPDAEKEAAWVEFIPGIRSGLDVPVKTEHKVLGVIGVDSKELNSFNEKDQELLEILASHAATAMSNLEHAKNLEMQTRELRESQERFRRLFVNNPEASVYLDTEFHIVDANPRFLKLFGYAIDEVRGKHINDVVVPDNMMEEAKRLDENAVKGYVYHDTVRKRKDGTLAPVSVSAASLIVEDKLIGYIGVYKDISEMKKLEEKLRVVGSLTRHDVRNKLTAVAGNAYLLRKRFASDPEATEWLRSVEVAVRQSERIFDFAGAYEKLGVEQLAYMDAKKILDEAVALFPDLKNIRIVNACGGLTLLADSLLRQLFYNLIDDSLKYGEKLTQIRIHYKKSEDQLKLVYEDDGVGISQDAKPKLFSEGYTTGKGSGYGLYLVRRMMDVYGWTIDETGVPGKGAQFTIDIPKAKPDGRQNYRLSGTQA